MMEPGIYYIGDLCYVMETYKDEMENLFFAGIGHGGEFTLSNGIRFAQYSTQIGVEYILEDWRKNYGGFRHNRMRALGRYPNPDLDKIERCSDLARLTAPFKTSRNYKGLIKFGWYQVNTQIFTPEQIDQAGE